LSALHFSQLKEEQAHGPVRKENPRSRPRRDSVPRDPFRERCPGARYECEGGPLGLLHVRCDAPPRGGHLGVELRRGAPPAGTPGHAEPQPEACAALDAFRPKQAVALSKGPTFAAVMCILAYRPATLSKSTRYPQVLSTRYSLLYQSF